MELICPSCRTRYLVPDEAVTKAGRQVSCTECNHEWTAFPQAEATPGPGAVAGQSASGASPAEAPPAASEAGQDTAAGSAAVHQPDATPDTLSGQAAIADAERTGRHAIPQQIASDPARQQQLAEIRKMLAEVQSGAGGTGAPGKKANFLQRQGAARGDAASNPAGHSAPPSPAGQAATAQPAHMPDKEGRGGAAVAEAAPENTETRPAHPDAEEEDYVDPPGFLRTGLLVVVLIVAAMTALYVLQPQITSRLPSTAPALTKYIELIDRLRANIASDYEWIKGKVTGETPSTTQPAGGDEEHGTSVENGTGSDPDQDAAASAGSAARLTGLETGPAAADAPEAGQRADRTPAGGAGTGAVNPDPAQPGAD